MIKVLFVCWGNICRSPMAEFIFKDIIKKNHAEDRFYVESAATHDDNVWNGAGAPVYSNAAKELKKHGISCAGKEARMLKYSDYEKYDYIIGMETSNIREMRSMLPEDTEGKLYRLLDFTDNPKDIDDPWYTRNFGLCYDEIEEGCKALFAHVIHNYKQTE